MSKLSRRQLLVFFGSSAAATVLAPNLGQKLLGGSDPNIAQAATGLSFTPVRLPHPLEIYTGVKSYLPTGSGQGTTLEPTPTAQLNSYTVLDDVIVPPEFERYYIVGWGDRVFPNSEEYFGYNCDFTGFIPVNGNNDGYLWVNHEYVSFPISGFAPGTDPLITEAVTAGTIQESGPVVISGFPTVRNRELLGEFCYNLGGSVVRIKRGSNGKFAPAADSKNRRLHLLSGLGINKDRTDGYQSVTSWGSKSYQKGDNNYLIGTGPAAREVFPLSSDGLGNKIIGTGFNCSGGVSPWGTIFSAEENFQGSSAFYVGVTEPVNPDGTQVGYTPGTTGAEFGQVGEKYGWIVEIDPANPGFRPRKHTALGRFRWENIAFSVKPGKRLIAYMGDDRRGGHTWKYVSKGTVQSLTDKNNSKLLEDGVLYVAKFNPPSTPGGRSGTGEWIPLTLSTPTNPISPTELGAGVRSGATRAPFTRLPRRAGIAGQTATGGNVVITDSALLADYRGKNLSDFYTSQGAVLVDAYTAANLVGGTPSARPEDLEVNPFNKNEVFIAYTDGAPGSDGYPDSRIFIVAKDQPNINDAQQSGGLYKIIEGEDIRRFRWERFAQGGEDGAQAGSGFANIDNLAFDTRGNIWGVTDMSTGLHNGFSIGLTPTPLPIDHTAATANDAETLVGVYGNNWLFYIPTVGSMAGEVVPFGYGPPRCEMTGPTFIGGETLVISVQHPGEDVPIDTTLLSRDIEILNLSGNGLFTQSRSVPAGSVWPSNIVGGPKVPRPSVIGIRRKQRLGEGGIFV
jgi:uncharacterized protein